MTTCSKCGRVGKAYYSSFVGVPGVFCTDVVACAKRLARKAS